MTATLTAPRTLPAQMRLALVGNPNTGKTTLFNELCGVRARTANYPGTTTAIRIGAARSTGHAKFDIVDLPGLYDLHSDTPESRIASDVLSRNARMAADLVVLVVDACNLTRNLVLVAEMLTHGRPIVIALNMMDVARSRGIVIDTVALARRLRCPVVPIVARRGEGIETLRNAIESTAVSEPTAPLDLPPDGASLERLTEWAERVAAATSTVPAEPSAVEAWTDRIDRYLTHPVYGMVAFGAVMCGLLWTLFALAAIPMDLIEALFGQLGVGLATILTKAPFVSWSLRASSVASAERSCFCRRSACCSSSSACSKTPDILRGRPS